MTTADGITLRPASARERCDARYGRAGAGDVSPKRLRREGGHQGHKEHEVHQLIVVLVFFVVVVLGRRPLPVAAEHS